METQETQKTQAPRKRTPTIRLETLTNLIVIRERFDWWWVLVGIAVIVAGNVLAYLALRDVIEASIRQGQALTAALLTAGVALLMYFIGGLFVGRLSRGHTVKEPAVAALVALVILFLLQLSQEMVNIVGLIVGAPFCFGVAYLGGVLGEKWQDWVLRH